MRPVDGLGSGVMDILSNALDACGEKEYSGDEEPEISIRAHPAEGDSRFVLRIRDNGCGMSPEVQANVFTPFFSTKRSLGTGLGLAITSRTIRLHGGEIEVESEVDVGTEFRIILPMDGPDRKQERSLMAKKVLVVDDNPNTVRFLSVALEENGYEPIPAFDGKEGFEKVVPEAPDLILLDVMMPKRTGFTLFKQLRKTEGLEKIPVIMLTGVTASLEEQDRQADDTFQQPFGGLRDSLRKVIGELKETGDVRPEFFIEKPIDPEEVIAKIRELIGD